MTGTEVDVATQAERIAARGRDALVERMRIAYSDAAAAHADLISLDDERIEAMVQAAADRADGLQWRRALAAVAAEELGLEPSDALSHPAVVRAQSLVGAPSYEQSLAEMIARPVPLPAPANGSATHASDAGPSEPVAVKPEVAEAQPEVAEAQPEMAEADAPSDQLEAVEADDVVLELLPEPDPIEYETEAYDVEASFAEDRVPPAPANPFASQTPPQAAAAEELNAVHDDAPTGEHTSAAGASVATAVEVGGTATFAAPPHTGEDATEVTIPAIHLGGVANLPTKREGLSVRVSVDGLDIMQGPHDIIGRLVWDEIEALEVPNLRSRRRSKQPRARLVVRTPHGDASFEVPDIAADDLRDRVEPLMRLYGRP